MLDIIDWDLFLSNNIWGLKVNFICFCLASYRKISCKDLGKGDCEGFLYRYLPKGTLSLVQWRLYWCVLKGGTLYVFKSKDVRQKLNKKLSIVFFLLG